MTKCWGSKACEQTERTGRNFENRHAKVNKRHKMCLHLCGHLKILNTHFTLTYLTKNWRPIILNSLKVAAASMLHLKATDKHTHACKISEQKILQKRLISETFALEQNTFLFDSSFWRSPPRAAPDGDQNKTSVTFHQLMLCLLPDQTDLNLFSQTCRKILST